MCTLNTDIKQFFMTKHLISQDGGHIVLDQPCFGYNKLWVEWFTPFPGNKNWSQTTWTLDCGRKVNPPSPILTPPLNT